MSWDFETEPEFQKELDWIDKFVREEVEPLDYVLEPSLRRARRRIATSWCGRCRPRSSKRKLWACHLGPELGGQGYGQVKLGADERDSRPRRRFAPIVFGCQAPDSGNAEILAHYGTPEQKKRYLAAAARQRDRLVLLDDRAAGRRRSQGLQDPAPS